MKLSASLRNAVQAIRGFRPTVKLFKRFGYGSLFSFLFSFFLFMSMPLDRFIPSIENIAGHALGRTVRIGDISTTLTGALAVSNLEIGIAEKADTESDNEGDDGENAGEEEDGAVSETAAQKSRISPMYMFEEVTVNLGMLAALMGKLDVDTHIEGLGGTLDLAYEGAFPKKGDKEDKASSKKRSSKKKSNAKTRRRTARKNGKASEDGEEDEEDDEDDEDGEEEEADDDDSSDEEVEDVPVAVHVRAEDINLKLVHDLRAALPVPISGTFNLEVDVESPSGSFEEASGRIFFRIENVLLSKKGYEAEIFGSRLAIPPLAISSIEGEIVFEKGEGKVKTFKVISKHIDITLEGDITLGSTLKKSRTDLYATFKVQNAYLNQSEAIRTIMDSADMFSPKARQAHRDDGYYGFRLKGPFGKGKFSPAKSSGSKDRKSSKKKSSRSSRSKRRNRTSAKNTPSPKIENDNLPPDLNNRTPPGVVPPAPTPAPTPQQPTPAPPPPPKFTQSPGPPLGHQIKRAPSGPGPHRAGGEASEDEEQEPEDVEAVEEEEEVVEEGAGEGEGHEEEDEVGEEEVGEDEEAEEEEVEEEEVEEEEVEEEDEDEKEPPPSRPPIDPDEIF